LEYRKLGRTDLDVSAISLGTEYLIDRPPDEVAQTIHHAIDHGVNYFDLFFAQAHFRDMMGRAFKPYRDRVLLAGHLGASVHDGQSDKTRDPRIAEHYLDDFLVRYDTDFVDLIFLHNSDGQEDYDLLTSEGGLLDVAKRYVREGKARFIAFSGHTLATALQAAESGDIDVIMFPVNMAGHAIEGKRAFLQACVTNNVGLVAMKPFAGGSLLRADASFKAEAFLTDGNDRELDLGKPITPVECLHYTLSQPGVSTTVPGCQNIHELDMSLAYWSASDKERDFSGHISQFQHYVKGQCVYCNHCLPCPSEIDIGQTLRLLDQAEVSLTPALRDAYAQLATNADDCSQCQSCMERCPFGVDVVGRMGTAANLFG